MSSAKKYFKDNEKINSSPGKVQKKKSRITKMLNKSFKFNEKILESELSELNNAALKFKTVEMERCSTPNPVNICEHCEHNHAKECCMYVYDDHSDIMKYSSFKNSLEEPYWAVDSAEDFELRIGSSTPSTFPSYTENDPMVADMKMNGGPPVVYLRQYFWPIYMPQAFFPYLQGFHPMPNPVQSNHHHYPPAYKHVQQQPIYQPPPMQYVPCVMKQIPIPMQYNYSSKHQYHSQVVESHFAYNYYGYT